MFIKICGITNIGDARAAVEQGASAIGFVLWPASPRFVEPERARDIIAALPPSVQAVGVFVNQPALFVNDVAAEIGLAVVQLHGDEPPAFAESVALPVFKAVALGAGQPAGQPTWQLVAGDWPERVTLLVDANDPVRRGGTGTNADWPAAATLARRRRVILAGGLTPENVADAIARVQPFGIDVSSGVERSPGVKDHQRLAALFAAVRALEGIPEGT